MAPQSESMITTATERIKPRFWKKRLLQGLALWYLLFWICLAIAPIDRMDWLVENMLVFVLVGILLKTYRKFPLSDLSYVLVTVFLTLHAIGAHYTYSKTPAGFWMQEAFGLGRNHYDRVVHFSFGLLMAYPIREVFLRVAHAKGFWAYYLPLDVTLAFSAIFEIGESLVAWFASPELGNAYLGAQGDIWDAQKDMGLAALGALICMGMVAGLGKLFHMSERVQSPLKT